MRDAHDLLPRVGKERGCDPYFRALYRVNFDGTGMKLLTPEQADHEVTMSPDGQSFVDVASTPVTPQTTVVRTADGGLVMEVAQQDISKLLRRRLGQPLTPITVKARDGKTDLYGFMFKPANFDPAKKYPIVDHVYPGPQTGSCGSRELLRRASRHAVARRAGVHRGLHRRHGHAGPLEELSRRALWRHGRQHHPRSGGGIKQLAAKYPWIDAERVGIYGHSGGGNGNGCGDVSLSGLLQGGHRESGNHDNASTKTTGRRSGLGCSKGTRTAPATTTARRTRTSRRT
jgi:dipeptidyl-peptidase-4